MGEIVEYQLHQNIATITIDDGKANAVSFKFVEEVNSALDQAESDKAVVIMTGRPGKFSAGFDLSIVTKGGEAAAKLSKSGAKLALRMLGFQTPIIIACNGHCLAMGALLLLSADYRIGVEGNYKIGLNEVAISMTMPHFGVEIARGRLSPVNLNRSVGNAEIFTPNDAVEAGFLDMTVTEEHLMDEAVKTAQTFAQLNMNAHYQTKLRVRENVLTAVENGIRIDFGG